MTEAVFIFNEDTRQWEYENIILYEIKGGWRMWWNKIQNPFVPQDFESIYDLMNYLAKEFNMNALFKLPTYAENRQSNCT